MPAEEDRDEIILLLTSIKGMLDEALAAFEPERKKTTMEGIRTTSLRYAQWIGVSDLVPAARLIEAFIRQSPDHDEAMSMAAKTSGPETSLPEVFAAAESIRAYLAEPAPGGDRAPLSAEP